MVVAVRRARDDRPPAIVGQARPHHGPEHGRLEERIFVERDPVEIHAAHALVSAGPAIEFDRGAARQDRLELALEMDNPRYRLGVLFEVAPHQIFGLVETWADISIARRRPFSAISRSRSD